MGGWDRLAEWLTTLLVASLAWVSGVVADAPGQEARTTRESAAAVTLSWALDPAGELTTPIRGAQTDEETLDQGPPPAEDVPPPSDVQPVDTVPLDPTGQEDIELLDQGTPPPTQPVAVEPVPVVAEPAPATVLTAPVGEPVAVPAAAPVATGPALPPGFGTGRVQVAAGSQGFPEGLAACHVGAVTGRAYVGIDCDGDDSFVGHAPSFQDFPFVVEQPFPFNDNDEPVPVPASAETSDDDAGDVFVLNSTGRAEFVVEDPRVPNLEATGSSGSVISLGQQAREIPRDRIEKQGAHKARSARDGGENSSVQAQRVKRSGNDVNAASAKKQKDSQKDKNKNKNKDKEKDKKSKDGKKGGKDKHDKGNNKKNNDGKKDENRKQESQE